MYGYYPPPPSYPSGPAPHYPQAGPPQASPVAGTAIAAAVLSFLGTVAHGFAGILVLVSLASLTTAENRAVDEVLPSWWRTYVIVSGLLAIAIAIALLVGGIQLLRRRDHGRILIATACALVIASAILAWVVTMDLAETLEENDAGSPSTFGASPAANLILLIFPIATLVLVLLPSTRRWCQPAMGPPLGYR